jgi:[methyl-Co(III) methanol-specific corrinoid protein]:coenzyme M methyltransferase
MTTDTSPKERLLRVLQKKPVDRPPVVCVGGMMNAAVLDVMNQSGNRLPDAYADADQLAALARDVSQFTGFENLALPFCMTLEAELLGSAIDLGTAASEAKVTKEAFASVGNADIARLDRIPDGSRAERVLKAIERTRASDPDEPIVGSLTGPISTSASLVDPITFLKELHKDHAGAHRVIDSVTRALVSFARAMVDSGVDVIAISDPTATGEILGPRAFSEYALRYLNDLADQIHQLGVPVIMHICGDIGSVEGLVAQLHTEAISTDTAVNLAKFKANHTHVTTMGNTSTYTLQFGSAEKVFRQTRHLVEQGVDIIAPACGLSTSTPLANIQALTNAVKES